ncbi:MAG: redoxin domain-containing protein [Crocinitomicaceae bacterium]
MKQLIFLLSIFTFSTGIAQEIKFNIPAPDTTIYMARYFGKSTYYADTADLKNGVAIFDGSKHRGGLYALILPNGRPFDFIIDGEPAVEMSIGDINDPIATMEVKKSANNKVLFDFMKYNTKQREKAQVLNEKLKLAKDEKTQESLREEYKKYNEEVKAYQNKLVADNPKRFVGVMIKMTMDVELPDHPRDEEGNITDSNFVYNYYVNHYWDNIDLKDYRVVNCKIFHNKLDRYFVKKGAFLNPDSVIVYAKKLIDKTDAEDQDNKVFQYIVHHITNKYESMQIVGMDKVFYFMATTYYCTPEPKAYWITDDYKKKVCERREHIGRTLIGNPAIPLILPDSTENNWINFYDLKGDYTVLYFWDPHCGHCKKSTPKLQMLWEEKFKDRNVQIYAIGKASGDDFEDWKAFIRKHNLEFVNVGVTDSIFNIVTDTSAAGIAKTYYLVQNYTTVQSLNYADTYDVYSTPKIFLLDKDGRILFKQISIGQLEAIVDDLTGHSDDEKLFPVEDPENGLDPDPDTE